MEWLTHETITLVVTVLSVVGTGIVGYIRIRSQLGAAARATAVEMEEQRRLERQQLLDDFQEWHQIAQASFQEVHSLRIKLNALELHLQQLEHVMREAGLSVPPRPEAYHG